MSTRRTRDFYKRWSDLHYAADTTPDDYYRLEDEARQNWREAKTDKGRDRWDFLEILARISGNSARAKQPTN